MIVKNLREIMSSAFSKVLLIPGFVWMVCRNKMVRCDGTGDRNDVSILMIFSRTAKILINNRTLMMKI